MAELGKLYNIQLADQSASGKVYKVRDVSGEKNVSGKIYQVKGLGGGTTINNQDITVTENGTYTADEGYTGLGTVEVQVPNPSAGTLSIVENGSYDVTEYATAEVNVPTGGSGGTPATKFGASVDTFIGDVDENGAYKTTHELFTLDMSGLKRIYNGSANATAPDGSTIYFYDYMSYMFYNRKGLVGTIDLSNLVWAYNLYMDYTFAGTNIDTVYLPTTEQCGTNDHVVLNYTFAKCTKLTNVYIQNTRIGEKLSLDFTFDGCSALKNVHGLDKLESLAAASTFQRTALEGEYHFDSLTTMGTCSSTFAYTKITKVYFPALTTFSVEKPFGSYSSSATFNQCTSLTEIHFRADMQATIEALTLYDKKFGATNATIYFDL